jgi:hypothetical protein
LLGGIFSIIECRELDYNYKWKYEYHKSLIAENSQLAFRIASRDGKIAFVIIAVDFMSCSDFFLDFGFFKSPGNCECSTLLIMLFYLLST